jgi:NAD(P)-dependent dehydrogenase (short-subunit alcohol dehydrogenase family)
MNDFSDAVAFVTGAAGGIGAETAIILAARGANVVAADRDGDLVESVAAGIRRNGGRATAIALDVTSTDAVETAVGGVLEEFGRIDLLANAAGVYGTGAAETLGDDEIARVMEVNFNGVVRTCRAVLPQMMERRAGAIVNMSSLHALNGQIGSAHYAASKAAVLGWTRSLAREKGGLGIRVNAVAPGPIDTRFWRGTMSEAEYQAAKQSRVTSIPLGRLGTARDVAETIVFLLGTGAAFITGQVISIGGGEIM